MNADAPRANSHHDKPLPSPADHLPSFHGNHSQHGYPDSTRNRSDQQSGMAQNARQGLQPIDASALAPGDGMFLDTPDGHAYNNLLQATRARH